MFRSRQPVSPRTVLLLGLALCVLPGCGGSGNAPVHNATLTRARSYTQTFQPQNPAVYLFSNDVYGVDNLIDQSKPMAVTVNGIQMVQGKDYFVDTKFPMYVHFYNPISVSSAVVITYTSLATATEQFILTHSSQNAFTLARPADPTYLTSSSVFPDSYPPSPPYHDPIIWSLPTDPLTTGSPYTITTGSPSILRLNVPLDVPAMLTLYYVPKMH